MATTITFNDPDGNALTLSADDPLPVAVTATAVSSDGIDTTGASDGDVLTVDTGESVWAPPVYPQLDFIDSSSVTDPLIAGLVDDLIAKGYMAAS